jgi:hypothetical protein
MSEVAANVPLNFFSIMANGSENHLTVFWSGAFIGLGIDLFLLLLNLRSSLVSQGITKMQRGKNRVIKQHTWASVAHYIIELLAHIRVEAMCRANTANRLIPRLVLATVDALYCVMQ